MAWISKSGDKCEDTAQELCWHVPSCSFLHWYPSSSLKTNLLLGGSSQLYPGLFRHYFSGVLAYAVGTLLNV
jgi:hypothetical protein